MEAETLRQLYEANYMRVYSYVMTLARNKDSAEEITQETFFRAMTTEKSFRGESDEFTWLCSIARNLFIDETRKASRISDELPEDLSENMSDTHPEPWLSADDADSSFRIHLALHSVEEPYREVFELRVFGELSFRQIGTIFGKTENWARVTYHRAKLKVTERMEIK